jgi:hypothetical protein
MVPWWRGDGMHCTETIRHEFANTYDTVIAVVEVPEESFAIATKASKNDSSIYSIDLYPSNPSVAEILRAVVWIFTFANAIALQFYVTVVKDLNNISILQTANEHNDQGKDYNRALVSDNLEIQCPKRRY